MNSSAHFSLAEAGAWIAVLSRNIQKLGTIKRDKELLRLFEEQQKLVA